MTITCEIEKKNNKNTQKKIVFLFTPGVHLEKNKKTTTTIIITTAIRFLDVRLCVSVDRANLASSFFRKNTFSSRAYLKFIDRKGRGTGKNHRANK
jgi:hypothetical protein